MCNDKKYRLLLTMLVMMCCPVAGRGQTTGSPCPELLIEQKYDHVPLRTYRAHGWDTAVTCQHRSLTLSTEPYMPVTFFDGTYIVEEIPYAPADPTFAQGTRMPVGTDDDFALQATAIPFNFFFFGIRKSSFRLGANGMITFATDQFGGGYGCPWKYGAPLPWPDGTSGAPTMPEGANGSVPLARMRDAIYGIYEDTHPLGSYLSGHQGIYYGIQGERPCRKIICSWNGIPTYKGSQNLDNRCTYQIVCYEGSNIVEVHVKRRGVNPDWQNGAGIIGLQNATGLPQEPDSIDNRAPNHEVVAGSPAYFCPDGKNLFSTALDSVAYRFVPSGRSVSTCQWYRVGDDGSAVQLGTMQGDSNGYVIPANTYAEHPTLTQAIVKPTRPSRYVATLIFQTADDTTYVLSDTIHIGIDTTSDFRLEGRCGDRTTVGEERTMDVCRGSDAEVRIRYEDPLVADSISWKVRRMEWGVALPLADSLYAIGEEGHVLRPTLEPLEAYDARIDTLIVESKVYFANGCHSRDTFALRMVPSYDRVMQVDICRGDTFTWAANGQRYQESTTAPAVKYNAVTECDSTIHLHLTVHDVAHTMVPHTSCQPYTWVDGRTYSASNDGSRERDTVVVTSRYGCDSVLHLAFTYAPVEARIGSDRDYFDYDNTTVTLRDESMGSNGRRWLLPDGRIRTDATTEYTIPLESDSAEVRLVAYSPYGCSDTAARTIGFRRATLWVPNIFTPDRLDDNRFFGPVGKGVTQLEMYVYNRLGQMVYGGRGAESRWDGRDLEGRLCEQGVYVYVIRYADITEPRKTKTKKGTVTLIR